ncbi:hypothetical protein RHECNPAF_3340038 [Rhizobium etli CNPAF512]|nr:hypothetical protein RHECNPAF_3340038 [Rhizobium etli CNPAF512]
MRPRLRLAIFRASHLRGMCEEFSRLRAPFAVPNTTQHRLSPSKLKRVLVTSWLK